MKSENNYANLEISEYARLCPTNPFIHFDNDNDKLIEKIQHIIHKFSF